MCETPVNTDIAEPIFLFPNIFNDFRIAYVSDFLEVFVLKDEYEIIDLLRRACPLDPGRGPRRCSWLVGIGKRILGSGMGFVCLKPTGGSRHLAK